MNQHNKLNFKKNDFVLHTSRRCGLFVIWYSKEFSYFPRTCKVVLLEISMLKMVKPILYCCFLCKWNRSLISKIIVLYLQFVCNSMAVHSTILKNKILAKKLLGWTDMPSCHLRWSQFWKYFDKSMKKLHFGQKTIDVSRTACSWFNQLWKMKVQCCFATQYQRCYPFCQDFRVGRAIWHISSH